MLKDDLFGAGVQASEGDTRVADCIPSAALSQHAAIIGKTGSGKTSTSKLAVEQVVKDGFRVCILDTIKSDWWGITSSADGSQPGLPFKILGGPRGHVPLHSSAGSAIGQIVGSGKLPLSIIDMADFEMGGVQKFFAEFAAALMRHARGVLYLVIEEAHEIAPKERAGLGNENLSIHWAKKLATAGRSKGIRLIVATQSVQTLHNSVLGSCETVIAHRLFTPAHQAPILKWLAANADKQTQAAVEESLSSLPTGTGWLCSGEARIFEKIAFPKFSTFDNAATPTDDEEAVDVQTAPVDQDELRAIIGEALDEAEDNDPKRLKAKVAELERELASAGKPTPPDPRALREAEQRGRAAASEESRRVGQSEGYGRAIHDAVSALHSLRPNDAGPVEASPGPDARIVPVQDAPALAPSPTASSASTGGTLGKAERLVLTALAQYPEGRSKVQVALLTGYAVGGGGFKNALGSLRSKAFIEGTDGLVITPGGLDALGQFEPLPRGQKLLDHWLAQVGKAERAILDALAAVHPASMTKDDLAAAAGYEPNGGGFKNALGRLRTLELISRGADIKVSDDLF